MFQRHHTAQAPECTLGHSNRFGRGQGLRALGYDPQAGQQGAWLSAAARLCHCLGQG